MKLKLTHRIKEILKKVIITDEDERIVEAEFCKEFKNPVKFVDFCHKCIRSKK